MLKSWMVSLFAALLLVWLSGCTGQGEAAESGDTRRGAAAEKNDGEDAEDEEKDELVPVEVATLTSGPIESTLRFSTNLEAESEVQVFSQSARRVVALHVEEGDRVRKGQTLLRLQDDEQRSTVARVKSQLKKAQREYGRQQKLYEQQLISEQVYNEATYEVEQLELQLADARRELSYTEVQAPISGTITQRLINLGDHITVNQHLFDLVDFDTIVARVYVPEKELSRLAVGQTTRLRSDSLGGAPRIGHVVRIAPTVDPRSGTVKVTVGIPANQGLRPGMYVEAELVTEVRDDALLVPKRALIYDSDQSFLYRVDEERVAHRLRVGIAVEDRQNIEPTAAAGLSVGDRVVVAGQAGLKNGIEVRIAGAEEPSADEPSSDGEGADGRETVEDVAAGTESTS